VWNGDPPCEKHLECIAGNDVLPDSLDVAQEVLARVG
jgi:hypothetical protein